MRAVGVLLLVVLLAMAVVAFLRVEETRSSLGAVEAILPALADPSATATVMDRDAALRLCDDLEALSRQPERIADRIHALRAAAETAAGWAAGAPPTSADHLAAVAIRSAVNDLRAVATGHRGGVESARAPPGSGPPGPDHQSGHAGACHRGAPIAHPEPRTAPS
jgi:hypothetical protein